MRPIMTFSIVAYNPQREEWCAAVQSKFLAVGAVVPWARADAGAVATQSYANLAYGPDGLAMMTEGESAEATLAALLAADEGRERRQVGAEDLIPLNEVTAELQAILRGAGYEIAETAGEFDAATRAALQSLVGMENLEERWDGAGDLIDRHVVAYLHEKFKPGS